MKILKYETQLNKIKNNCFFYKIRKELKNNLEI